MTLTSWFGPCYDSMVPLKYWLEMAIPMMNYHWNVTKWFLKQVWTQIRLLFEKVNHMKLMYEGYELIKDYFKSPEWNCNFNEILESSKHPSCVVIKMNEMES